MNSGTDIPYGARTIVTRIAIGFAAGAIGSLAMNVFARAVAGDRSGHGVQPPQAESPDQDATVRAGAVAFDAASGHEPPRQLREPLGTAAHYAFGGAMGVLYALLTPDVPALRTGRGALYGTLVWMLADEGAMPALGLSRAPQQLSLRTHAYALAGHLVYGVTAAAVVAGFADRRPVRLDATTS